jgi:hypothetical protein
MSYHDDAPGNLSWRGTGVDAFPVLLAWALGETPLEELDEL